MAESFDQKVRRYARAIWQSEIDAGNGSTDWPRSVELEETLVKAAGAAAGVMMADATDFPVHEQMKDAIAAANNADDYKALLGNAGLHARMN